MLPWMSLWGAIGCGTSEPAASLPPPPVAEAPAATPAAPKGGKAADGQKRGKKGAKRVRGECPDGVAATMGWQGEYPSPIADVTKATTVEARVGPCHARAAQSCVVPAGVYHPWSDVEAGYVTVRGVETYEALRDFRLGEIDVKTGATVSVVFYLGEGYCLYDVGGADTTAECPDLLNDGPLKAKAKATVEAMQLIEVACDGGKKLWVDVATLMKQPEVREGTLIEYGRVGPGT